MSSSYLSSPSTTTTSYSGVLAAFFLFFVSTVVTGAPSPGNSHHLTAGGGRRFVPDFVKQKLLPDGETERLLRHGPYTALETSAFEDGGGRRPVSGLRLVQITDGKHFVQNILDARYRVRDCEYVRDRKSVRDFLSKFGGDFDRARALHVDVGVHSANRNRTEADGSTLRLFSEGETLPDDLQKMVDYRWHRDECKELHLKIKAASHVAKNETTEGDESKTSSVRSKRELLIYPGTNWCGVGSASDRYNDLGWSASADRCCRQHDHCPYVIEGFAAKYNLFNYRFHTLSHCECDERFRSCLKMVNSGPSNMVGKLFFNVVQMKCFVLKSEDACIKRSWWGRCLNSEKQLTAYIKDVITY